MSIINLICPISLFTFVAAVFLSKNPVHGVLSFVVIVLHVVVLLISLDLEFLAYVLAIVYIGAIVVLFLFVIMMFYIHHFKFSRSIIRGSIEYYLLGWCVTNMIYYIAFFDVNTYVDFLELSYSCNFLPVVAWYLFNEGALLTIIVAVLMLVGIVGAIILTVKSESSIIVVRRILVSDSIYKTT